MGKDMEESVEIAMATVAFFGTVALAFVAAAEVLGFRSRFTGASGANHCHRLE